VRPATEPNLSAAQTAKECALKEEEGPATPRGLIDNLVAGGVA